MRKWAEVYAEDTNRKVKVRQMRVAHGVSCGVNVTLCYGYAFLNDRKEYVIWEPVTCRYVCWGLDELTANSFDRLARAYMEGTAVGRIVEAARKEEGECTK